MTRDLAAEAGRWLAQAEHDLGTARLLVDHDRAAVACFLAQQAAEKALKGLLYAGGADLVLGHSVGALCREVAQEHPELTDRCPSWSTLDQHYIPTRYPDALPGGTPAESYTAEQGSDACDLAAEVLGAVAARIPRP